MNGERDTGRISRRALGLGIVVGLSGVFFGDDSSPRNEEEIERRASHRKIRSFWGSAIRSFFQPANCAEPPTATKMKQPHGPENSCM